MSDRAFSSPPPTKKEDVHGSAKYVRRSHGDATNLTFSFEQALRLSLSIQSCLFKLNSYNRSTTKGRNRGLCLTIFPDTDSVTVTEGNAAPPKATTGGNVAEPDE